MVYYENTFNIDGSLYTTGARGNASAYLTSFLGNHTLAWLNRVAAANAAGGPPFFGYLGPHAPHFPAEPAPWYADAPLPSTRAPRTPQYNASGAGKHWVIDTQPAMSERLAAGIDEIFAMRHRALLSVDDIVRDVAALLRDAGRLDDTYWIYTSDHVCGL